MEGMKNRCAEKVKDEFRSRYREYLGPLVRGEHEFQEGLSLVRVSKVANVKLNIYPNKLPGDPWELRFNFTVEYTFCNERDEINFIWEAVPMTDKYRFVHSKAYHAIFREQLTQKPEYISSVLKKRKINMLCLIDYNGTVTKEKFRHFLWQDGIFVVFVKGLQLTPPWDGKAASEVKTA